MGLAAQEKSDEAGHAAVRLDPIDRAHLARFTLGDVALEIEVLDLFLGQAPLTLASLADARTDKAWRDAAHTLKGSARAVGAFSVARAAQHAERSGHRLLGVARLEALSHLADALDDARLYITCIKSRD